MRKTIRTFTALGHLAVAIVVLGALSVPTARAEAFTFRGEPSGWLPNSFEQTVVAPCHSPISAKITAIRYDHHADDVPITIEFRAPGVSVQSPPTHTRIFQANYNSKTETFQVPGVGSGCDGAWRVRIVPLDSEVRDGRIVGDLSIRSASTVTIMPIEDAAVLANGRSTTKTIGGAGGLHQGWVDITGTWNHSVFGVPGPLPVKLTFSLLKPNGEIAAFDAGHSDHEFNPCCSGDKLRLRFLIREHIVGQWKLRITNDSGQDAMTIIPRASFKPACR